MPPTAEPSPVPASGARPGSLRLGVVFERKALHGDNEIEQLAGQGLHSRSDQLAWGAPGEVQRSLLQTSGVDRPSGQVEVNTNATVHGGNQGSFRLSGGWSLRA